VSSLKPKYLVFLCVSCFKQLKENLMKRFALVLVVSLMFVWNLAAMAADLNATVEVIPGKINVKSKGVLPVVIRGAANLDVTKIDPASIQLEGVTPVRFALGDMAVDPNDPEDFADLFLKFKKQEIVKALVEELGDLSNRQVVTLHLTATLNDGSGTTIVGEDDVLIKVPGGKHQKGQNGKQNKHGNHQ
jgi:hypothetical protein